MSSETKKHLSAAAILQLLHALDATPPPGKLRECRILVEDIILERDSTWDSSEDVLTYTLDAQGLQHLLGTLEQARVFGEYVRAWFSYKSNFADDELIDRASRLQTAEREVKILLGIENTPPPMTPKEINDIIAGIMNL